MALIVDGQKIDKIVFDGVEVMNSGLSKASLVDALQYSSLGITMSTSDADIINKLKAKFPREFYPPVRTKALSTSCGPHSEGIQQYAFEPLVNVVPGTSQIRFRYSYGGSLSISHVYVWNDIFFRTMDRNGNFIHEIFPRIHNMQGNSTEIEYVWTVPSDSPDIIKTHMYVYARSRADGGSSSARLTITDLYYIGAAQA